MGPFQTVEPHDVELYAMGVRPLYIWIVSYLWEVFSVGRLGLPGETFGRDKTQLRICDQSKSLPSSTTRAALLNVQLP